MSDFKHFLNVLLCSFLAATFIKNVDAHYRKDCCTCACATLNGITLYSHLETV